MQNTTLIPQNNFFLNIKSSQVWRLVTVSKLYGEAISHLGCWLCASIVLQYTQNVCDAVHMPWQQILIFGSSGSQADWVYQIQSFPYMSECTYLTLNTFFILNFLAIATKQPNRYQSATPSASTSAFMDHQFCVHGFPMATEWCFIQHHFAQFQTCFCWIWVAAGNESHILVWRRNLIFYGFMTWFFFHIECLIDLLAW